MSDKITACPIATAVAADIMQRADVGLRKYGVTLAREDLELEDWLQHAYEECLDHANYLKRSILMLQAQKKAAAEATARVEQR